MSQERKTLLICDDREEAGQFCACLGAESVDVIHDAQSLARESIENHYDVVVVDMTLAQQWFDSPYTLIHRIQAWDRNLAVVSLFDEERDRDIVRALSNGVQDYMVKGTHHPEVVRRVMRYAVQRKRYEEKIAFLTMQDHLTGLMNGELVPSTLRQAIYSAKREKSILAVYYVDIDHFRGINDEHGHDVGNALLIEVASRLQAVLDENSVLSRLSGDTFVIIDIAADLDACAVLAEEIISCMKMTATIAGIDLNISASIGVATYPECGNNHTVLMRHAEMALIQAKEEGRGHYRFFSRELNEQVTRRIHLTTALKEMSDDDMFRLHYQPKIDLRNGAVTGVEALIRWEHPVYGNIRPDQFIPLAEEAGLMPNVSSWVLRTACTQHQARYFRNIDMCVNISATELCSSSVVDMVRHTLETTNMPPQHLVMEITETAMLSDTNMAISVMKDLKALGIKLYIDDFGIGYSSIDYLRRYPVDALKIDRSFIMQMHERPDDVRVVRLMIDIARELGLHVIAEGVERQEQQDILRNMGCDEAQGYFYSKPVPADAFIDWFQNYTAQKKAI